jgi:hypothetical protein
LNYAKNKIDFEPHLADFFSFPFHLLRQLIIQLNNLACTMKDLDDIPKNYFPLRKTIIILYAIPNGNGHSGGGRFIFSYLDGVKI